MKFSEQWLREWVNPDVDTKTLAAQLTMAGLEVDAIDPVAPEFEGVVVGEISSIEKHPDADKLRVCQVNIGATDQLTIVCGAANARQGLKAPLAIVGAKLPGGLKIKKGKLRGVESFGMLCSEKELGLAEEASGLMELPGDAPAGASIRDYLQLDDNTIELGLTPNRGDCLSIAGIAREVGVLSRQRVTAPAIEAVPAQCDATFPIRLAATRDCPHYAGRVIRNINPAATTPVWMQEKLRRCGVRSLSPVVDVTNYVLLELGQPMHAFDLSKLKGSIVVRHAEAGEKLTTLDGAQHVLLDQTLIIADDKGPLAMAGIMGGADSAVDVGQTRDIFLESAYFNPLAITGKARAYGLHTDSSHRFERGVSPDLQIKAIERATALLLDIVGGEPGPVSVEHHEDSVPSRSPVKLRQQRIQRLLGVDIPAAQVAEIMEHLGMQVSSYAEGWLVTPPAFRFDIELEEDLIEEVARIHGYNNLPDTRPRAVMVMQPQTESRVSLKQIRQALIDLGYQEAITYSFVEPRLQSELVPDAEALALANPISADLAVMRTSLWPGLVGAVQHNLNRQQDRICLFECGLNFIKQGTEINQIRHIGGAVSGSRLPSQWSSQTIPVDFFDAKAHVEAILQMTGELRAFRFVAEVHPALHPGQTAAIYRGELQVGWLGMLHPAKQKALGLSQAVYLFEMALELILPRKVAKFSPLSRFPAITRDLAIVVDEHISAERVQQCVKRAAPGYLKELELFDVYMGKGIDSGRKSLALGLTLQDLSRTLTDEDVEQAMGNILFALKKELKATLRE